MQARRQSPLALLCALPILLSLTACAQRSTLVPAPPVDERLMQECPEQLANPLTTGDLYDVTERLVEVTGSAKECAGEKKALINAVRARQALLPKSRE
ncbi:MAG: hypothetical protein ACN6O1_10965 [Comamonas sp.]|uniref:Rz1-like lysis system protein LysC n=1 Tax=Comamonas sp. TaxID=34028 RepID=UPI003D12BD2F